MRKHLRHKNQNHFHTAKWQNDGLPVTTTSTNWMIDDFIVEPREQAFLEYKDDVSARFEEMVRKQMVNEDVSMNYARSKGVENEWDAYHFFAQEDVNAPTKVFEYIDDEGKLSYFSEAQQKQIQEWTPKTAVPIEGIQGHHIETVKENPSNATLAADSDNIIFATLKGHRDHLHGGNTQNNTQESYRDVGTSNEEKLKITLDYNEDLKTLDFWEAGSFSVASSAAASVTISAIIEWMRLRKDPRPWFEKRRDLALSTLMAGIVAAPIGAMGYTANVGIEHLIGEFSIGGLESFFGEMLALNGSFFAISLLTAGFTYIRLRRKNQTHEQAYMQFRSLVITATAELAAFSVLGIGIEVGLDTLGGLVVDAILPDPTGILIALRLSYSVIKIGKNLLSAKNEKAAFQECLSIRREYNYKQAEKFNRSAPSTMAG